MKNASLWALTGAGLVVTIAYACAVPVEVKGCPVGSTSSDCDIQLAQPYEFGGPDASVGQGGNAGSGDLNPPSGGSAGTGSPPPGGSAGSPPGGGSAGQGQSGSAGTAGTAGAGGSAGSSSAGAGGSAGTGTAGTGGSAGTSAAGTGGTGTSNFSVDACDFQDTTGCAQLACATACPNNGYCPTNCPLIITCVSDNVDTGCVTADDPMCGVRNGGTTKACTMIVESSGGTNPNEATQPSAVARALIQCLCADPRP